MDRNALMTQSQHSPTNQRLKGWIWVFLGMICLAAPHAIGSTYFWGFQLDLGSIRLTTPIHTHFLLYLLFFGGLGTGCIGLGVTYFLSSPLTQSSLFIYIKDCRPRPIILGASAAAFAIPVVIRWVVLEGAPLTDDESAYQFMAELIASGRIYAESHPWKLFFDRAFIVNDGKMYSQYFLGWPLLMAPGTLFGIEGYMNAIYCAATIPPLFFVLRETVGNQAAKLGVVLFVLSPMMMFGAATQLSHTSCLCALAWAHSFVLRGKETDSHWKHHAAFGFLFSLAFLIRPVSALGIGFPLLVYWAMRSWKHVRRITVWIAWGIPTIAMAGLFFVFNWGQTGDPLYVAYQAYQDYSLSNQLRFSRFEIGAQMGVHNMQFSDPVQNLALLGVGVLRANFAFFGWFSSFAWLPFALKQPKNQLAWWMVVSFLAIHFPLTDGGIDSFGPVHYTELFWPVLLLTSSGFQTLWRWVHARHTDFPTPMKVLPAGLLLGMVVSSFAIFIPVRSTALAQMAQATNRPFQIVEQANLKSAVIFVSRPMSPSCDGESPPPPNGHAHWPPVNDPDFQNPILWANHLSLEKDQALMKEHFPNRTGWLLAWQNGCDGILAEIDKLPPGSVPNGIMRTGENKTDRYNDSIHPSGK